VLPWDFPTLLTPHSLKFTYPIDEFRLESVKTLKITIVPIKSTSTLNAQCKHEEDVDDCGFFFFHLESITSTEC
jgi:hypothetical protein